ncbi:ATP-binding protein [Anaerolineales bacterium HSG25]|nr:ATP-binding protein [Anaerolineales bacterium HSG25]
MSGNPAIQISVPSQLGNEKIVMSALACLARKEGIPLERIEDLKTAVSEAVTNAIEHGNASNENLRVQVKALFEAEQLQLSVVDESEKSMPTFPVERKERADHRGWGMMLIEALMDEVESRRHPDGNELQMVMYLDSVEENK